MTCLIFHDWSNDCERCARCGKRRNRAHQWSRNCAKCKHCKKENHKFSGPHRRCSICSVPNMDLLTMLVRSAKIEALQRDLLGIGISPEVRESINNLPSGKLNKTDIAGVVKKHDLEVEQRRQNNLQNLLQPIANDWDINIDVLIKMAHEMSTFL
jgi:hypothetical protein